jgi:pimeloyl-ACP methyl ester carboxylesterase
MCTPRLAEIIFWALLLAAPSGRLSAAGTAKLSLTPPADLVRADFYSVQTAAHPRAVLVLCPGCNDSGKGMVEEAAWQEFARKQNLGLVGVSFASKMEVLADWRGYHIAAQGSGQALLDALQRIYKKELPIYLYGVSSGALFICQFVEWRPERVAGWCAYAAGEGGVQTKQPKSPPGLIACGEYDGSRYGAMLGYFKQGRAMGKPWLWVSLAKTDHVISLPLERFVREYFSGLLAPGSAPEPLWVDIDRKALDSAPDDERIPSVTAWLPKRELLPAWQRLHQP